MLTVKLLKTPELISDALALLYEVYIEELQWKFAPDNPSKLRVETQNGRKILTDRFTDNALWFGAFDDKELIGCMRLTSPDSNNKFELEGYSSSKVVHKHLPKPENGVELSKIAIQGKYAGQGVVKRMWLVVFKHCQANQLSVICNTHNGYLKNMFKRIGFPLVMEHAFKYEPADPMPVNLYVADSKKHIPDMVYALECLDGDLSPNSYKIFKALELVAPILPVSTYWHDVNGVVLGVNEHCLNRIGSSYQDIVGKSPYEFYPEHTAEHIVSHNAQVIRGGEVMAQEEWIEDITTGSPKCFLSTKAPLYDDEGKIIGVIGSFVEITGEKEAEKLRLENQAHQVASEEQDKFKKVVGQVLHDMQSPLSSIRTIVDSTREIPEIKRIRLRTSTDNIVDITNQLLDQFKPHNNDEAEVNRRQAVLVAAIQAEVLSDRRYKYRNQPIKFECSLTQLNAFIFIKAQPLDFKRAISNLINNAIDALPKTGGKIEFKLKANEEWVYISILDDGCGMPEDVLNKVKNSIAVTSGKEDGHGIGLTQIKDMLANNYGTLEIASSTHKMNHGTTMTLKFPRMAAPVWIAQEIALTKDSIVVILDDDSSIHGAWDSRLAEVLVKVPSIRVQHHFVGQDTIDFIEGLSPEEKVNVWLLSDYELIKQELNGLQVIKQCKVKQSVLVTSYYADLDIRKIAMQGRIKILPKDLAYAVTLKVVQPKKVEKGTLSVHMVFVDDEKMATQTLVAEYFNNLIVDQYDNPFEFLDEVDKYTKDTKIVLDNYYYAEDGSTCKIDGISIAKELHEKGFTKLFLLSGENFTVPDYLTLILKMDKEKIKMLDKL